MKKLFLSLGLVLLVVASVFSQAAPAPPPMTLKVGDMAPDFTLTDLTGRAVTLSEFRGKNNVVLAFYVFAFTGG